MLGYRPRTIYRSLFNKVMGLSSLVEEAKGTCDMSLPVRSGGVLEVVCEDPTICGCFIGSNLNIIS